MNVPYVILSIIGGTTTPFEVPFVSYDTAPLGKISLLTMIKLHNQLTATASPTPFAR